MILTWLWKMFLGFRRSREQAVLEAPRTTPVLGDFVNHSSDMDNSGVVIFEGDEAEAAASHPAKA